MRLIPLAIFLLFAVPAAAQMSAGGTDIIIAADGTPAAGEWYSCGGAISIEAGAAKYAFTDIQVRKLDGAAFEIKAKGKDPADASFSFFMRTLNPAAILRPGTTYVSEGNLENGETFGVTIQRTAARLTLSSQPVGTSFTIASVRGSTIKATLKGTLDMAGGQPVPFTGTVDFIDARK